MARAKRSRKSSATPTRSRTTAKKPSAGGKRKAPPRARAAAAAPRKGIELPEPLPCAELRWHCDPALLTFDSTTEVEPATSVVGQDTALEALRFGLETNAPGQNVYVRGLTGTGRMTLIRRVLESTRLSCPLAKDCCYVYNFAQPDQPRLITLPAGRGGIFRRRVDRLIEFIRDTLQTAMSPEPVKARRASLEQEADAKVKEIVGPFEKALGEAGLALVRVQAGPVVQTAIHPVFEGQIVSHEEFDQLHTEGRVNDATYQQVREKYKEFDQQIKGVADQISVIQNHFNDELQRLYGSNARWILGRAVERLRADFPESSVQTFLSEVIDDVVTNRLPTLAEEDRDFVELYRVNLLVEQPPEDGCPIVVEPNPTVAHLLGTIEYQGGPGEEAYISHMGIRAGALLRADGGYLILEARDVLEEPEAWRALTRVLRNRQLRIRAAGGSFFWAGPALKPEPIALNVKVILLGDSDLYYMLDAVDPDFSQLFKVLADFDSQMPRDATALERYAAVLAQIAADEQLPPFDRTAVAAWIEHGARMAAQRGRLSARFGRLADIAREAALLAQHDSRHRVGGDDVRAAVRRAKQRASLPSKKFREYVAAGTIRIDTRERIVGQINGLAVLAAGPIVYGFPCRLTATIGPGTNGVINIERESALSGSIHTKGFYILGGLLRHLLRTEHPLTFSASLAFEQSYGGIDGDSASGAEACCLISALTDIPLRQGLAMTGAIDQFGHILAIGAVNEKIEGFFDTCYDAGLTGKQGVIIPRANAGDLMLRDDVVAACAEGRFHVYAVDSIQEALTLLTEVPAGEANARGAYPRGTILGTAVERAGLYWQRIAAGGPGKRR